MEDTSNTGRRKRSIDTTTFYVEIADTPGEPDTIDYATVGQQICNQVGYIKKKNYFNYEY